MRRLLVRSQDAAAMLLHGGDLSSFDQPPDQSRHQGEDAAGDDRRRHSGSGGAVGSEQSGPTTSATPGIRQSPPRMFAFAFPQTVKPPE